MGIPGKFLSTPHHIPDTASSETIMTLSGLHCPSKQFSCARYRKTVCFLHYVLLIAYLAQSNSSTTILFSLLFFLSSEAFFDLKIQFPKSKKYRLRVVRNSIRTNVNLIIVKSSSKKLMGL